MENSGSDVTTILVSGAYGTKNLGDNKVLSSISRMCRDRYGSVEVVATSIRPRATVETVGVDDAIPTIERDPINWLSVARSVDLIVIGGGSVLGGSFVRRHAIVIGLAQFLDVKIYVVAAGICNSSSFQTLALKHSMNSIDAITVRDDDSRDELTEAGVSDPIDVVPDPGFLPEETVSDVALEGEYVLVCCRSFPPVNRIDSGAIATALDRVVARCDTDVVFLPFQRAGDDSDIAFSEEIRRKMDADAVILRNESDISRVESIVRDAEAVLAIRLHSMILAAQQCTPFTAISYHRKCDALLKRLGITDYFRYDSIDATELAERLCADVHSPGPFENCRSRMDELERECHTVLEKCDAQDRHRSVVSRAALLVLVPLIVCRYVIQSRFDR
jgi:polysaccharide pyruvyl transferase CsaB